MDKEQIDVVWARTGERVWPLDDPRRRRADRRTLRERLDIPRDADDDTDSPLLTPSPDPDPRSEEVAETERPAPPRGSLAIVAARVIDADARRVLVTDVRDPEVAQLAADALVDELGSREVTAAHLHVGRADHGETPLAGSMDQVDEFVALIAAGGHPRALATGGGDPEMVEATVDRLLAGVDRVVITGTGTGLDRRQVRLADLADAVVVHDEHQMFDPRDQDELLDGQTPIIAILEDRPATVDESEPQTPRRAPVAALLGGLTALAALIVAGWFVYQAVTDEETEATEAPTTAAPPTTGSTGTPASSTVDSTAPTVAPTTAPAPPTTRAINLFPPDIDPDLLAAPSLVLGDTVSLRGAVRTETKASRIRAAAEILADGDEVDDQLLVDPAAAPWIIVRVEGPLSGMREGNQFSPAGQRWADAIEQLLATTEARVQLSGGTSDDGPHPIAWLLAQDLRAKGFDPVEVTAVAPGRPPVVLEAEVESPES